MTARNTSLIVNRFRTAAPACHKSRIVSRVLATRGALVLLCALLLAPLTSQAIAPTEGQEVAPSTSLEFNQIAFFHGPQNSDQAFLCTVYGYESPSSIDCDIHSQSDATIELVGIWHDESGVTGHRVFITREAKAGTYHYEGALSPGGMMDSRWISGSYTVTKRVWKRIGWRWYPATVTTGPYPFTASVHTILDG